MRRLAKGSEVVTIQRFNVFGQRLTSLALALGLHVAVLAVILVVASQGPTLELPKAPVVTVALIEAPPTPALQHAVPTTPKPEKQARKPVERKVAKTKPPPDPAPAPSAPTPVPVAAAAATPPAATAVATAAAPSGESASVIPPDLAAAYRSNPAPLYPALCRRRGEEGKVFLRVRVSAEGAATAMAIEKSSGYARLDEAAKEAVGRWAFVPARQAGKPVAATVIVPITFRLEG